MKCAKGKIFVLQFMADKVIAERMLHFMTLADTIHKSSSWCYSSGPGTAMNVFSSFANYTRIKFDYNFPFLGMGLRKRKRRVNEWISVGKV